MKKHKENLFSTKFRLLNSQEYSEEIIWSSSDSSEFEYVDNKTNFRNITNKKSNLKRKRKSKAASNVSNLDITIIDANKEAQGDKSPVLTCKTKIKAEHPLDKTYSVSNLVEHNSYNIKNMTSPVLCTGTQRANLTMKSPIIAQKYASPVQSPKVRKTLFGEVVNNKKAQTARRSVSPVICQHFELDRRKFIDPIEIEQNIGNDIVEGPDTPVMNTQNSVELQEDNSTNKSRSRNSSTVALIQKVKSFFDNQFNSENSSQVSIADTPTPQNTSDDVEIISITQMTSNESSVRTIKHTHSTDNSTLEAEKSKKIRYKKDGLAYRLSSLLKKHSANISLWQHERFLAENSSFKIPKGEHLLFRIQKIKFKYGSYLLEAMDANDEVFLILINNSYVNNCVFSVDSILKIYEPYQMFSMGDKRLIVNVCKFECVMLDV